MKKNKARRGQEIKTPQQGPGIFIPEHYRALTPADRLAAAALWACTLAVYLLTLCPTVSTGDAGEFAIVAACWGVSHPPGYPLYTLLNCIFVRLFPFGEIAWRVNLLSAIYGSCAVTVFFALCRRIGASLPAACAAAVCLGTGSIFWGQAVEAEVYCLDMLLILLALTAALRLAGKQAARDYFLFGLAAGFMVGHRVLNLVYFMPVLLAIAAAAWKASRRPLSIMLYALLGIACSGIVFVYLPVASSFDPPADWGDPETVDRFFKVITGGNYKVIFGAAPFAMQLKKAGDFFKMLPANLGFALLAAPAGFWLLMRRRSWILAGGLAYAVLCCVFFAAQYHVFDYTVFFLPGIAMLALAAASGFDLLPGRLAWAAVLLGLVNLPLQYAGNDLSRARLCEQYGRDVLAAAPPGALVLVRTDTENNVLGYLQHVSGLRPDIALSLATPLPAAKWFAGLLKRQYPTVNWPAHDSRYYYSTGKSWVKDLVDNNLPSRPVCMLDPPEMQLRELSIENCLPSWKGMPDGVLYCLDSPGRQRDTERRMADNTRFWKQQDAIGISETPDIEFELIRFKYVKARFFYAESLADADKISEAAEQLKMLLQLQPDALEEKILSHYRDIGMHLPPILRIGKRAEKALQTLPASSQAQH